MKLIHKKLNNVVVEFIGEAANFSSEMMEWDMENNGIAIPEYLQEDFGGDEVVYLDNPYFQKAFQEVYCVFNINREDYEWKE